MRGLMAAVLAGALGLWGVAVPPKARADMNINAINGTFTAISDGAFAKTNETYHDEQTVISTWTITSSCTTVFDCTGQVVSDQGWTATAKLMSSSWLVTRVLPDWEHCDDGTSASGTQTFLFFPDQKLAITPGVPDPVPGTYKGYDRTIGVSGACGISRWLSVEMPFRLIPK